MRGVDQQHLGPWRDGGLELDQVQAEVGAEDADAHPDAAGQVDGRGVGVVEGLQGHHLVAGVDEGQDRRGQGLGSSGGDEHLGVGIVSQAVVPRGVVGDGLPERGDAAARRVLVEAGRDGRPGLVEHEGGAVGVRKALTEVHRAGAQGERGHLREDAGGGLPDAIRFPR